MDLLRISHNTYKNSTWIQSDLEVENLKVLNELRLQSKT